MLQSLTTVLCVASACLVAVTVLAEPRNDFADARNRMVDEEIVDAGVKDQRVIAAMRKTPRHEFVPLSQRKQAYLDMALPIGESQTITAPFVVAAMTEALDPKPDDKVLEIGTGSGYQAAVLSGLVGKVYTIEIVAALGQRAAKTLKRLQYDNVYVKVGDGYQGWPEHAPFDKIIVTCSPESVPPALVEQLTEGGRMIIPVGERYQQTLYLMTKKDGRLVREALQPTLFVPMTGKAEEGRQVQPDPANPSIRNGGFEEVQGDPPAPVAWHYQRQLTLVTDGTAPEGKNYITLSNQQPGRHAQALQGLALDGRKVKQLAVSLMVRGEDLRPGPNEGELPKVLLILYDDNRTPLGTVLIGPWNGTFPWQRESQKIDVPPRTREAFVCLALAGAVGKLSFDAIELKAVKSSKTSKR